VRAQFETNFQDARCEAVSNWGKKSWGKEPVSTKGFRMGGGGGARGRAAGRAWKRRRGGGSGAWTFGVQRNRPRGTIFCREKGGGGGGARAGGEWGPAAGRRGFVPGGGREAGARAPARRGGNEGAPHPRVWDPATDFHGFPRWGGRGARQGGGGPAGKIRAGGRRGGAPPGVFARRGREKANVLRRERAAGPRGGAPGSAGGAVSGGRGNNPAGQARGAFSGLLARAGRGAGPEEGGKALGFGFAGVRVFATKIRARPRGGLHRLAGPVWKQKNKTEQNLPPGQGHRPAKPEPHPPRFVADRPRPARGARGQAQRGGDWGGGAHAIGGSIAFGGTTMAAPGIRKKATEGGPRAGQRGGGPGFSGGGKGGARFFEGGGGADYRDPERGS